MILAFPRQIRRRRSPAAYGLFSASTHVFPRSHHTRMVATIASQMLAAAAAPNGSDPLEAAEAVLVEHLELDWSHLEQLGVDAIERESEVRAFATAAWTVYRSIERSGAA